MREHLAEIDAIGGAAAAPTFANTVAALDRAGRRLERIGALFHNLTSSETSPALQAVEREMAPILAGHDSRIYTHVALFARIDALHAKRASLGLSGEQTRVLERFHLDFVRAGAKLAPRERARYAELMQRLAELTTRFGQNVLADESDFQLVLKDEDDLVGLPDFVRAAAHQAATDRGLDDVSVITLSRSHIVPFLTFSERRDLREQAWRAWTSRGEHPGASDNRGLVEEILGLRLEQARLHGYASYADFALSDTMARSQAAVAGLLERVWKPARARAEAERAELAEVAREHSQHASRSSPGTGASTPRRCAASAITSTRPRSSPTSRSRAWSARRSTAPRDCSAWPSSPAPRSPRITPTSASTRCEDAAGVAIGLFLHDNFARPTKRSGAWMSAYRMQSKNGGDGAAPVLPIIVNNNNFAKGAPGEPTLLSFDDARTLFHEFGHGLHGLLSNVTYERVSGTNVLRDFVELPSQLFEHWLERARGAEAPCPAPPDRRADSRRADRAAARGAPLQPGLRDGALRRLGAGRHGGARAHRERRRSTSSPSSAPSSSASDCRPASASTTG